MNSYELSDYKNIMRANNLQIIDQAFKEDYESKITLSLITFLQTHLSTFTTILHRCGMRVHAGEGH